jgi:hypothetical protein
MTARRLVPAILSLAALAGAPANSFGQRNGPPSYFEDHFSGCLGGWVMQPVGDLGANIGTGLGGGAAGLFRLDRAGLWSLRADLGIGGYGSESKHVPLSPTIGGRIQVDVNTTNYVFVGGIGPQFTMPSGIIRPYVNAGAAFQLFFTDSNVEGADDNWEFANTTNHSDWTPAWTTGGGVYIPLHYGRTPVLLDLGATYYLGGHATYLKPGSIEDLPNSQIRITPMESNTPLLLWRIGVKIGR